MTRLEARKQHAMELYGHDMAYTQNGVLTVSGMDEAGRGPLIGPVVTACVVMPMDREPILWVDDSKKLSEKRRESVYEEIMASALYVGIGTADAAEIDRINILQATKEAMRKAASQVQADIFLIDAVTGLGLAGKEVPIIHGDAVSYHIAAASIIAKVTRDRMLIAMDEEYPMYGLKKNKGYGTAEHIQALKKFGPCPYHRKSFIGHFCEI